jgi:hypothetical protein
MTKKNEPERYKDWLTSHNKLVETKGWGREVKAYSWKSEKIYMFPIASLTWICWRMLRLRALHPLGLLSMALTDLALIGAQILNEYRTIDETIAENQSDLEQYLIKLKEEYERIRVVAHSTGCKLVLRAVEKLPLTKRPHYLHLCAPAIKEHEVSDWESLSQFSTSVYYCILFLVSRLPPSPLSLSNTISLILHQLHTLFYIYIQMIDDSNNSDNEMSLSTGERDLILKAAYLIFWGDDPVG